MPPEQPAAAAPAATAAPAAASSAAAPSTPAASAPSSGTAAAGKTASAAPIAQPGTLIGDAKPAAEGEVKPGTEAATDGKAAEGEPAALDLKLPEGMEMPAEQFEALKTEALEVLKDVPQEKAQALFAKHLELAQQAAMKPYQLWHDTQQAWQAEVKADPEVGGANLDANLGRIAQVIDSFGGAEAAAIKEAFNFTGAGNNPMIVRLMHRIAQAATEGSHVEGKPAPSGQAGTARALASMYPSSSNAES